MEKSKQNNLIILPITKKKQIINLWYKLIHNFGHCYWTKWEDVQINRYIDTKTLYIEQIRRCQICNKAEIKIIRSQTY